MLSVFRNRAAREPANRFRDGIHLAILLGQTEPRHTDEATIANLDGSVMPQVNAGMEGKAQNPVLLRHLGLGLARWPSRHGGGSRVPSRLRLDISFRLIARNHNIRAANRQFFSNCADAGRAGNRDWCGNGSRHGCRSGAVEIAINAITTEVLAAEKASQALLDDGESERLEFKSSTFYSYADPGTSLEVFLEASALKPVAGF